jgi:hypothetical protein
MHERFSFTHLRSFRSTADGLRHMLSGTGRRRGCERRQEEAMDGVTFLLGVFGGLLAAAAVIALAGARRWTGGLH